MAHAGTPTDLAKQPATSSTNGLWQALLAATVALALVAGMVFVATNLAAKSSVAPATQLNDRIAPQRGPTTAAAAQIYVADGTYDQIEAQRGAANFSAVKADRRFDELILAPAVHYPDVTYDQVQLSAPTKISGTAPDNGPGRVQGHRGAMIDQ
jgi:hypothetical protein